MMEEAHPEAATHTAALRSLYRGEVRHIDAVLGALLDGLSERGLLDASVVVLTSDHGEVMDRPQERWDHGHSLVEEAVRVPLFVRLPLAQHAGSRVRSLSSHVDLLPTLASLFGLALVVPTDGLDQTGALRGHQAAPQHKVVFAEATKPWSRRPDVDVWLNEPRRKMARTPDAKAVYDPADGSLMHVDLAADPGEQAPSAQGSERLGRALKRWIDAASPLPSTKLGTERHQRQLEALGYVEP
jgi:arylsulfatase A-like enzyme